MEQQTKDILFPLGVGIGLGAIGVWALIQLFPVLVLGGAGYIVYQGLTPKENNSWQKPGQNQK